MLSGRTVTRNKSTKSAKSETIKAFLPLASHEHVKGFLLKCIVLPESRFVIGPSNILFGGVSYV